MSIELHILLLCAKKKELRISDISHSDKCGVPAMSALALLTGALCVVMGCLEMAGRQHSLQVPQKHNSSIYRILIRVNKNSEIKMDNK